MNCLDCGSMPHKPTCVLREPNPFLSMNPAQIDVLEDMVNEWSDLERHGQLNGGWGYGPKKSEALSQLYGQIWDAWVAVVKYQEVESVTDRSATEPAEEMDE